nr:MAG TPA: hypothetical protein [Caudoviricetes sp.]
MKKSARCWRTEPIRYSRRCVSETYTHNIPPSGQLCKQNRPEFSAGCGRLLFLYPN